MGGVEKWVEWGNVGEGLRRENGWSGRMVGVGEGGRGGMVGGRFGGGRFGGGRWRNG